jgi:hypothetical protein
MPCTAKSPSGPRKPVRGVRCPILIASDCAREIAGMATRAAEPATPCIKVRREMDFMASSQNLFGCGGAACRLC